MTARAIIFGCAGPELCQDEAAFFTEVQPWGFILFARNLVSEAQVRHLTHALRKSVTHRPHIFIDEEGGRVSRLRELGGWIGPPAADFWRTGQIIDGQAAVRANYRAIGARLAALGITADCAPVLDVPQSGADPIIGDRAFCTDPAQIAPLGQACLDGLADAGIAGVIKHIPGHGRAQVDTHLALPIVATSLAELIATDFVPFTALAHAAMAMTAHIVYSDIDPEHPATTSAKVIDQVIRKQIGFTGLLLSDDLDMKALQGTLPTRATQALAAGCDMLLHCSGNLADMRMLAECTPVLQGDALARAKNAEPATESCQICPIEAIQEAKSRLRDLS
ncbi:MAG: beta-N-acetylhexosaminidase [Robiginitomaculum sp.]|nr:beta-N-acetylhexosaminidase [Robiginitomaculum sp.]